jgi:AraC-like DNA-binding protein
MSSPTVSNRGILNPAAGDTHFHIARHPPTEGQGDLAFFVERHWIVRWDLRGREPYLQETLPQPCANLVIEARGAAVHGVGTDRFSVLLEGKGQVFGTKFKPGAFDPFLRRPMSELTDRSVSLAVAFGDPGDLAAQVLASEDDHAQIALVEAFLAPRLPPRDAAVTRVIDIVRTALDDRAITRVEDLAARVAMVPRALQRLFQRYVGVSPKWVIRRFRMHEAADRIAEGAAFDGSAMAHDLGYFDQAHFIRDFRAQVGRTPTEYAALCASDPPAARRIAMARRA